MFEFVKKIWCKDENLYKAIVDLARNTLDLNQTKQSIINIIGKELNADRCLIMEYDKEIDNFKNIQEEYLSSNNLKSYIGVDLNKHIPNFISEIKKGKRLIFNSSKITLDNEELNLDNKLFEKEKAAIKEYEVCSAIAFPIFYANEFLGDLVVHYVDEKHKVSEKEIHVLSTVAVQMGVAIYQANLFNRLNIKAINQSAILNNMPFQAWIKDKKGVYLAVNNKFCENYKMDASEIIGKTDFMVTPKELAEKYTEDDSEIMRTHKQKETEEQINSPDGLVWAKTYKSSFYDEEGNVLGTVGFSEDITERKEAEIRLLNYQKQILRANQREVLLRTITEKIRSSLNLEDTLSFICEETAKLFNVQRAAITTFPNPSDYKIFKLRKEYKISENIKEFPINEESIKTTAYWRGILLAQGDIFAIDNIELSNVPDYFKNTYRSINVKSIMGVPIQKGNDVWGTLVLSEYNYHRTWTEDEKILLRTIANQIYIAINQAALYEKEKLSAERERISRSIIEILRSSIDKTIIKKLFVKNVGKFFNANRVILSEYDNKSNQYLPVDNDSEYLSSKDEKSFIGFDWSNSHLQKWLGPLLEKREIKVVDWEEYINKSYEIDDYVLSLYKEQETKSKYGFPITYQNHLLGFFCLEFTKNIYELQDEDLERIRSICSQAGIALYHANLYQNAKKYTQSVETLKTEILDKIKQPTQGILDISLLLSENEFQRPIELDYLNKIINSCNQLMELTKAI